MKAHKLPIVAYIITAFISFLCTIVMQAQVPKRLEEIKSNLEKIQATFSGKPETFDLLITEGKKGIAIAETDDFRNRYSFMQAIASGFYYKQQFDSASFYFEKAYSEAKKGNLIELSTKPLGNLASIYNYMGLPAKADTAILQLKQILDNTDTLKNKSDIYYNLGLYYQQQKSYYSIALDYFLKSAALHKNKADTTTIPKVKMDYAVKLMMVAEVYLQMKQAEKALQYLKQASPYIGSSLTIEITCYGKFIRTYAMLNNLPKAKEYYTRLQDKIRESPGNWSEAISSNLEMHKLALHQQNFTLAKFYLDKAEAQALKDKKEIQLNSIRINYGEYYLALKDYPTALKYLKMAEPFSLKYSREAYADLLKALTEAQFMTGNAVEAGKNFQLYNFISDSLTKQKISLNIAEMEAVYQNKEKQLQIENKNRELTNAAKQRAGLLIGLSLVAISALLLFIIYRNKRKTANILESKNKELSKLNKELNEANRTKAKLFGIISHDLRSPISQVYQFLKLQQLNPDALDRQQRNELSNKIQAATGSLLETMEDLLLWSKTQMANFHINLQQTNLTDVIEHCHQLLLLDIENKKISIATNQHASETVITDPYFLQIIIRNLLHNAIKASPENGRIETGIEQSSGNLTLFISNQGTPFTQTDFIHAIEDSNGTTLDGLGLKLIAELSMKTGINISFTNPNQNSTRVNILFTSH